MLPTGLHDLCPADPAALLQAVAVPLLEVQAGGILRWANAPALGVLGAAAAVGQPLAGCWAQESALDAAGLCSSGPMRADLRLAGSATRWVSASSQPLASGGWLLTLEPCDERRAAEQRAQRLDELLELVREFGRIGLWERDVRTLKGSWDRRVREYRGLDMDAPAPDFESAAANVLEPDRSQGTAVFRASLAQAGSYSVRYRVRAFDGTERRIHSQWVVKNGSDGRPQRVVGMMMDDTEPFALAQAASQAQSQLALAMDVSGIGVWRHDMATDRMHYSPQALSILGLESADGSLPAAQVRQLIHPDDRARVEQARQAALRSGQAVDVDVRFHRTDGTWRNVMTRRVAQVGADGQLTGYMGVSLDVTERIEEQRRADELTRRFELVTRTAGIGWWVAEEGAMRSTWSEPLRHIFGLAEGAEVPTLREWLVGSVHPADRERVRRRFTRFLCGRRDGTEIGFRALRPDGQVRHLYSHARFEAGQRGPTLFGVVVDLTEQRRQELALRAAAERAALAARGAGVGTWELDPDTGTMAWDEQMWLLRGLQPRDQPLDFDARMACLHPEDRAAVRQRVQAALDAGQPVTHEFRVIWPDGQVRWLASRSVLVHDEAHGMHRRIGVNWDTTVSRMAEAAQREREIALRESEAKSRFLARMSHELRTPLNAVLGFAQLLMADEPGGEAAHAGRRRRLEHIQGAGQHLLSLINDVLDLATLQGGEVRIELQPVALEPLVAQTLPLLGPLLDARRVHIVRGTLSGCVMADPTRLRQALLNLLSNAIKYNREDGRVTIDAVPAGAATLLRVADTGRGMSTEQLQHLFEPFNRLGADADGIEGTGIGLAIVKALVERMNGSLHVQSRLGAGSVFEISLATAGPGVAHAGSAPGPHGAVGARHQVLYIEDNPVNARIVAELLARRPELQLHLAADGFSGLALAASLRPELILLDMQLPDIDGLEVLARLRAEPATASIPCMALSANAIPGDIRRALQAGICEYWTKPLDFKAFMAALDRRFAAVP